MLKDEPDWSLSHCSLAVEMGVDPDDWFPSSREALARAVDVCHYCPLQVECELFAIDNYFVGVWGGRLLGRFRAGDRPLKTHCPEGHRYSGSFWRDGNLQYVCDDCDRGAPSGVRRKVRSGPPRREAKPYADEIRTLTVDGYTASQISEQLRISKRTVTRYRARFRELEANEANEKEDQAA